MSEGLNERRPHHVNPAKESIRVILATKNWSNIPGVCSVGLSVTAANTAKILRKHGIHAEAWQVKDVPELYIKLRQHANDRREITHVVCSAPSFLQPSHYIELAALYPDTEFVQLNHTGTSYLSIDKFGIKNIRATIDLSLDLHNVKVAFNNPRGALWADSSFGGGNLLLPNLYDTDSFVEPSPPKIHHDPIRVGSFGASRPWKNQLTAAEGAVELARRLGVGLEFFVNSGRSENQWGGGRMIEARRELFNDLHGTKLIDVPWTPWPNFRRIVRTMDLLISPSFDETFCVVVADGIAEGVPSVTTGALEWTPKNWHCDPWDPTSVMHVGMGLLHDRHSVHQARQMLKHYAKDGLLRWEFYLSRNPHFDIKG